MCAKLLQLYPPGSFAHGILQARILEWVAITHLSDPGIKPISLASPALQAGSLPLVPPGKPSERRLTLDVSDHRRA